MWSWICHCEQSQEFAEGKSSSSLPAQGEDYKVAETLISLVTTNQEEKHKSSINNYSYLPPIENLREYILECAKPLKKLLTNSDLQANLNRLNLVGEEALSHIHRYEQENKFQ